MKGLIYLPKFAKTNLECYVFNLSQCINKHFACLFWLFWKVAGVQSASFHWHFKLTFEVLYEHSERQLVYIFILELSHLLQYGNW